MFTKAAIEEVGQDFNDDCSCLILRPRFAWTAKRVYFIEEYDGHEYIRSVPRSPNFETSNDW